MARAESLRIRSCPGGAILAVKAVPNASRDRISGPLGDALKVTTAAPPEKGKANAAIARILAKALRVGRKDVEIVAGESSPIKEFRVAGLSAEKLRARIEAL